MSETRVGGAYVDLYVNGGEKFQKDIEEAEKKLKEYIDLAVEITKKKKDLEAKMKEVKKTSGKDSDDYKNLQKEYDEILRQHKDVTDSAKKLNEELENMMKELSNNLSNELKKQEETAKNLSEASEDIAKSTKEIEKSSSSTKTSSNPFKEQQKSIREMQKNLLEVNKTLEHGKQIQEKIKQEQDKTNKLIEKNKIENDKIAESEKKRSEEFDKRLKSEEKLERIKTNNNNARNNQKALLEEQKTAETKLRIEKQIQTEKDKTANIAKRLLDKQEADAAKTRKAEEKAQQAKLDAQREYIKSQEKENKLREANAKLSSSDSKRMIAERKAAKDIVRELKDREKFYNSGAVSVGRYKSNVDLLTISMNALRAVFVSLSAKKLYDFLIEPNAQLEQHLVQFNTLLGSMENAQRMMNDIIKIAKITPFETNDVVEAIEILSQYGEAQQDLIPTFNKLADLSRGNADNLNNIALAYGRIKNSGKVTLRELNIMIRRGVPVMQAFTESTGKSTAEIYKMIRAGELGVDVFENAINHLATNGGRFEGLVAEQGKTLKGRISTLKDDLTFIGKDIGEQAFEQLSFYIGDIIAEIERLEATGELREFTESLGQGIGDAVKKFIEFSKTLYSFKEDIAAATSYLLSFIVALKTLDKVDTGLKAISTTFKEFKSGNVVIMGLAAALSFATTEIAKVNAETLKYTAETRALIDDSKRLTDTYNKQIDTLQANASNASKLTRELQTLMGVVNKTAEEHSKITDIITELNSIYPELNLRYDEERGELNRTIPVIDAYIKKITELKTAEAQDDLYTSKTKQKSSLERELDDKLLEQESIKKLQEKYINEYKEIQKKLTGAESFGKFGDISGNTKEFFNLIKRARELRKLIDDLTVKYGENSDLINQLNQEYNVLTQTIELLGNDTKDVTEIQKELNKILNQSVVTYKDVEESLEATNSIIHQTFTDLEDGSSALRESIDGAIDSVDELTEAIITNGEEEGFNADAARELISTYPELKDAIYQTAEGYKFEEEALISLKEEKIQAAKDIIQTRIQQAKEELRITNELIKSYAKEGEGFLKLKTIKMLSGADEKTGNFADEYKRKKDIENAKKEAEELEKLIAELENDFSSFDTQVDIASSTFGRDTGKKSKKDTETEDEEKIRNLKFDYDMGIINAKQYYDSLEKIKDKYYAEGSKKWQQYTLEIKQGREKVDEEAKKLAEEEFKTTYESMKNQLDDEEHFDRLSKEQKVERLKEIRNYIKDSYDKRLIDYETYKEEYRQISRDIYSTEKDVLKESIDELNELRDKKYKSAVEQIEKYYEDIDKAQEAAEREQELKELRQTEQLYEGAVSRAGQEKLKDLQKDIKKLEDEKVKEELEAQREYHLENLDAKYKALEESQNEYFETVQGGIKTTATIVGEYTSQIAGFFSQINEILNTARGESVQTSNNLTINQNIYDSSSNRAAIDMSQIVSSYGFK